MDASALAIASRIGPTLYEAAAAAAGRPSPRIVAGLPVAVHDDIAEARSAVADTSGGYAGMVNYRRIIEAGGASSAADIAIVGNEAAVTRQLRAVIEAGATDIWAQPVAVGVDRAQRSASLLRVRSLLSELSRGS